MEKKIVLDCPDPVVIYVCISLSVPAKDNAWGSRKSSANSLISVG